MPTTLDKVLYTAEAHTTGGRDGGAGKTSDSALDVKLNTVYSRLRLARADFEASLRKLRAVDRRAG